MSRMNVLIVDDSYFIRESIARMLKSDPEIEALAAKDYEDAIEKVKLFKLDVIVLNVEMPGISGLDILYQISRIKPIPAIMMSKYTEEGMKETITAFRYGAVDFMPLPEDYQKIYEMKKKLILLVKSAAAIEVEKLILPRLRMIIKVPKFSDKIVVIGASTGGPQTIEIILSSLPRNFPSPIIIVQHMPAYFTRGFAERLSKSGHEAKEAEDGDELRHGMVLVAPGGKNIKLVKEDNKLFIKVSEEYSAIKPSIDIMLESVSEHVGENAVVVILTGMGNDGSKGAKLVKLKKGKIICQDRFTSLIFGMPESIIEESNADYVLPLQDIPEKMVSLL